MTDVDMNADAYRVTGQYVTPKVRDNQGAWTVRGWLQGAVIKGEHIDPDSLRHHLESGLMEPVESGKVTPEPAPEPIKAEEPKVEEPKEAPKGKPQPAKANG